MERIRMLVWALLSVGGTWLAGCEEDDRTVERWPDNPHAAFIQIVMGEDSLVFLPGDTATADGWAVVVDGQSNVMPGQHVQLLVEPPETGWIEYLNSSLRDTTDTDGRVYFRFLSNGSAGWITVQARIDTVTAQWPLVVSYTTGPIDTNVRVWVETDTLYVEPGGEDSVQVCARVKDANGMGMPGILLPLRSPQGGRLVPMPPTDSTGTSCTWWYSNGQYGRFCFSVFDVDSAACVVVLPR